MRACQNCGASCSHTNVTTNPCGDKTEVELCDYCYRSLIGAMGRTAAAHDKAMAQCFNILENNIIRALEAKGGGK